MGICNAPASFQRLMMQVLGKFQITFSAIFLDDILVASENIDQHFKDLQQVFDSLEKASLKLHPRKCHFFKDEI